MIIANFIIFDIAWAVTIFSAAAGLPYIGVMFTLLWAVAHLWFIGNSRLEEFKLLLAAAIFGLLFETLLIVSGLVSIPEQAMLGIITPVWMVTLWINLAMTLNHSLAWFKDRYKMAALLGVIAGPLAYGAGEKLNAIYLSGTSALIVISVLWLIAMPLLFLAANIICQHKSISDFLLTKQTEKVL